MASRMIKIAKAVNAKGTAPKKVALTRFLPKAIDALTQSNCDVLYFDSVDEKIPYNTLEDLVGVGVDGIFCLLTDTIDENIINKSGRNLKVVSTLSVGYDHLDVRACTAKGIRVGNTPRVLDVATAEIAISLVFNCKRKIIEASLEVPSGRWGTWSPLNIVGLKYQTLL